MAFSSGQLLTSTVLNNATQKIVSRGNRTTNSTVSSGTTEIPDLRLDNISVKAGYLYLITVRCWLTTTATSDPRAFLHLSNSGSATISSTQVDCQQFTAVGAMNLPLSLTAEYVPSVDETISVLLSHSRAGGSGNVTVLGGTNNPVPPIRLYVINMGLDPGDTGVDL